MSPPRGYSFKYQQPEVELSDVLRGFGNFILTLRLQGLKTLILIGWEIFFRS